MSSPDARLFMHMQTDPGFACEVLAEMSRRKRAISDLKSSPELPRLVQMCANAMFASPDRDIQFESQGSKRYDFGSLFLDEAYGILPGKSLRDKLGIHIVKTEEISWKSFFSGKHPHQELLFLAKPIGTLDFLSSRRPDWAHPKRWFLDQIDYLNGITLPPNTLEVGIPRLVSERLKNEALKTGLL